MPDPRSEGVFVRRNLLAPLEFARLLAALDRLSGSWTPSQSLGLLGRAQTSQIRASDIAVQGRLDEIRQVLAPSALHWARACGFRLPAAPHVQMFPVRMTGDAKTPAYQEPHLDSDASQPGPPICTNVFYARARGVVGGELAAQRGPDIDDPVAIAPAPNTIVTLAGDRVHWVQPLYAGDRLSVVVNFY